MTTNNNDLIITFTIDGKTGTKYSFMVESVDDVMDRYMKRSLLSVLRSYLFRKNKRIKTSNIYVYNGDAEAHRLLNRNFVETIVESIQNSSLNRKEKCI